MFDFLLSVLRDIYVTLEGFNQLINSDMKSWVVKLSEKFKRQNKVEDAFRAIDQIRVDCLTRNASLKLALLSMCLKVKELSHSK